METPRGNLTDSSSVDQSPMRFQPERVLRARQQVEKQLKQAILTGVFRQGERLPSELKLAEEFSVSRATIREALRSLVAYGLITKVAGSYGGSFVEIVDHHALGSVLSDRLTSTLELGSINYEEVAEFRDLLEIPSVRLAAERGTDRHIASLWDIIEGEKHTTVEDPRVPELNATFHSLLGEASGNRVLSAFVSALHRIAKPLNFINTSPEVGRDAVRHHIAIVSAVQARDPEEAASAMKRHLEYLRRHTR